MLTQSIFLDACLGIVPKMKILLSSNPESLNLINNGDLTLQIEAYNNFTRVARNYVTDEKYNRNKQIPSDTKSYSLESGAVICCSITADYRGLYFFWILGEIVMFYNTDNQNKYL